MNNKNNFDNPTNLFLKIWRSIYLKNKILYYLKKFNYHYYNVLLRSYLIKQSFLDELKEGYITSLILYASESKEKILNLFQLLPDTIESIEIGDHGFNHKFELNEIPFFLKRLVLNLKYNQVFEVNVLPPTLTTLIFNQEYNNKILSNILPESLTYLKFGSDYNHSIEPGVLPKNLKKLEFSDLSDFNQTLAIGSIPESVTSIKFGRNFDQSIEPGVLPLNLEVLEFYENSIFNKPLQFNSLPNSITILLFGDSFDQPLYYNSDNNNNSNQFIYKSILPSNLLKLKFGLGYKTIKPSIFNINTTTPNNNSSSFFSKFKDFKLSNNINSNKYYIIPDTVKSLVLSPFILISKDMLFSKNNSLQLNKLCCNYKNLNSIPTTVKKLKIEIEPDKPLQLKSIPNHITHLDLGDYYDTPIKYEMLSGLKSLKSLKFSTAFDQAIKENSLPESITFIEFGSYFNTQFNKSQLPKNLKHLILGQRFRQELDSNSLPDNLISLKLSSLYNKQLKKEVLRDSLRVLEIGIDYSFEEHKETFKNLNKNLEKLIIRGDYISNINQILLNENSIPQSLVSIFIHSSNKHLLSNTHFLRNNLIKFYSNDPNDNYKCDYLFKKIIKGNYINFENK